MSNTNETWTAISAEQFKPGGMLSSTNVVGAIRGFPLGDGFERAKRITAAYKLPVGLKAKKKKDDPKCAELYVYDVIGEGFFGGGISAKAVAEVLDGMKDSKSLNVYINSPGGDVFDGVAIHNLIKRFEGKKTVYIDGLAASAASVIAMAGDEIIANKNSSMMIHDAWGFVMGNAAEMRKAADDLEKITEGAVLNSYLRTGQSKDQLRAWMASETWFNADEMFSYKFVDTIEGADEEPDEDEDDDEKMPSENASRAKLLAAYAHTPPKLNPARLALARMSNRVLQSARRTSPTPAEGQPSATAAARSSGPTKK